MKFYITIQNTLINSTTEYRKKDFTSVVHDLVKTLESKIEMKSIQYEYFCEFAGLDTKVTISKEGVQREQ